MSGPKHQKQWDPLCAEVGCELLADARSPFCPSHRLGGQARLAGQARRSVAQARAEAAEVEGLTAWRDPARRADGGFRRDGNGTKP